MRLSRRPFPVVLVATAGPFALGFGAFLLLAWPAFGSAGPERPSEINRAFVLLRANPLFDDALASSAFRPYAAFRAPAQENHAAVAIEPETGARIAPDTPGPTDGETPYSEFESTISDIVPLPPVRRRASCDGSTDGRSIRSTAMPMAATS